MFSFTVRAPFLQDGCRRLWLWWWCHNFHEFPSAQDADRMRIVESNDVEFLSFGFPFKLTWAFMDQSGDIMSLLHCRHGQIGQVAACGGQIPTVDWCESLPVCLTSVLWKISFATKMLTARWPRSRCKAGCMAKRPVTSSSLHMDGA